MRTRVLSSLVIGALAVVTVPTTPASADDFVRTTTTPRATGLAEGVRVYPVPTSAAGLGRIVTAPDGDMWFTEENANKIGRITPSGRITEYVVAAPDGIDGAVPDLDVAPDGTVWLLGDHGRLAYSLRPSDNDVEAYWLSESQRPYGKEVEIGQGGVPWFTMSFDDDGLARIVNGRAFWDANAPECDDALAKARDGSMWCRSGDGITRSNATASGGTTYPLPASGAAYPYSLAAGPVGSIWFARYFSGTWISAPDDGDVGWLDQASGRTRIFDTGEDTAPFSLRMGPDKKMWFTSIGDAAGIGHIDASGRGALTKVGNYEPRYLTFSTDGAVWFTDSENNVIVRVPRSQLQRTNVDPGDGSVFSVAAPLGTIAAAGKPLVVKRDRVPLRVACPKGAATCRGKAVLKHPSKAKAWTKAVRYAVKPGKRVTVLLKLTGAGRKAVKRTPTKARIALVGDGRTVVKKVKVRR